MQRAFFSGLACIFLGACTNPELCRQDFNRAADAAQRAFDAPDSAGFAYNLAIARASFECSAPQNSGSVDEGDITARNSTLLELEAALPCRLHVNRIGKSLVDLKEKAESPEAEWDLVEKRWEAALKSHPSKNDWQSSCLQEDADRYKALVDEGSAVIGYRLADDVLEQVEAGIEQVQGLLKGGIERIKEAVE